ncbi:ThuA domain-containing protein [Actinospica durhamensis]|uniref:ThuA domain-containing protein n=1 Tax=Actinospica durhamensis TaxID=1508375 RepID=A0A941EIU0_9ACTN|nr:ThuA domain-containing protein [Actinospica durhamensis]MBR7832171.1 ThuA domain-containing protein [Actinospica durhamensis]
MNDGRRRAEVDGEISRILVFTKTTGYRHDSIPAGVEAFERLGLEHGFAVEASEGVHAFRKGRLARYDAVVFLSTSGEVLDDEGREALVAYMDGGGSWLGVHGASTTEYDWPYFGELVGAWFDQHPAVQPAVMRVEDDTHPATAHLGTSWARTDEWYSFRRNPRADVRVLLSVDEAGYEGGTMGPDHPIAWCRDFGGGRSFYTALGHADEAYLDVPFQQHLLGALNWLGVSTGGARPLEDGQAQRF